MSTEVTRVISRPDITPKIRFSRRRWTPMWTPGRVRHLVLTYDDSECELIELFAIAIVDVIGERESFRTALRAACGQLNEQRREATRLRERANRLCDELRAARSSGAAD